MYKLDDGESVDFDVTNLINERQGSVEQNRRQASFSIFADQLARRNININATNENIEKELRVQNQANNQFRTYKIRWFMLFIICIGNISNTVNWIMYSPIANYTASFYSISDNAVNTLSVIFMIIAIPTGLATFFVADYFGIKPSILISVTLNFIGSSIRLIGTLSINNGENQLVKTSTAKYAYLVIGQVICAFAGPFILYITTKFANSWFPQNQRAIANTLCLVSTTVGILISNLLSSLVVNDNLKYKAQMQTLNIIATIFSFVPFLLGFFIKSSLPPTPPSYGATVNRNTGLYDNPANKITDVDTSHQSLIGDQVKSSVQSDFNRKLAAYKKQVKSLLKSANFLILTLSFGFSMGVFNSLATLLEQMLCTRGYGDGDAGLFGALIIFFGIFASIIVGILLDKTKKFEEITKILFAISTLGSILFAILQQYDNDKSFYKYSLMISLIIIGFFGLPLLPCCMELSVECVYPCPEATSSGILYTFGQLVGILAIVLFPLISQKVPENSYTYISVQTCTTNSSSPLNNSTNSNTLTNISVLNFNIPIYAQTLLQFVNSILFIIFFKCSYLRVKTENRNLSEHILNSTD